MFDPTDRPRLFALPLGADFGRELVAGLMERAKGLPPDQFARIELFVNTRRMQRRLRDIFDSGPPMLLPRLRLITDLAQDPGFADLPPPVPPLRRRLELTQLVARLIEAEPDLAPRAALFDLADSLAGLMDEMQSEGVRPEDIAALDVSDQSGHWQRALKFLMIVEHYLGAAGGPPDAEERQRLVIERLVARWKETPPDHPVIIAGSTGSRGATALLMEAVAHLPQGAVVLPGFDFDLPQAIWDGMDSGMADEDHPQFRFRRLMRRLGLKAAQIRPWTGRPAPSPARNRLISLALRPPPVTDQWRTEGPALRDLDQACAGLTLLEAPSPRLEAETIALRLRQAVDEGKTAALITPDRMLTRQVAAALDRWRIVPDDSAGLPLALSPPGRFLRHVGGLLGQKLTGEALLVLLKHPLCHTGAADRGPHLRRARELELDLRRHGPPFPSAESLRAWAERTGGTDSGRIFWAEWLGDLLHGLDEAAERPLEEHVSRHLRLAEALAGGPEGGSGTLWNEAAGREALALVTDLSRHAGAAGQLGPRDYTALFERVLAGGEVRNPDTGHPQVLIWGAIEARVQGADLIILGSMNEGSWPEAPAPDPWLNRKMRRQAGLLSPERRIGLSAHDFQQAVAGAEVWITRAIRDHEAQTVASRWVNRLVNLLDGLPETGGRAALEDMRARGQDWLARAAALSEGGRDPKPAHRPSPRPPLGARPRALSVTQIKTLIRDPYAIYARHILRLKPLDPLVPEPDAALRGTLFHAVLERFVRDGPPPDAPHARQTLLEMTETLLEETCPWPIFRRLWRARMENVADWFLETETERRARGEPAAFEIWGEIQLDGLDFTIGGKADRIDRTEAGGVVLYDYKTGHVPSENEQMHFDKQLLLEAAMVARGAFDAIGPAPAEAAEFIGLGAATRIGPAPLHKAPQDQVWDEFHALIRAWSDPARGYSARPYPFKEDEAGDYDHLARRGEWDISTPFTPETLT